MKKASLIGLALALLLAISTGVFAESKVQMCIRDRCKTYIDLTNMRKVKEMVVNASSF